MEKFTDEDIIVQKVIEKVGKILVVGTPLGAGKPNHILNAFYRAALNDNSIDLTICTALTLQRPKGESDLEKRFMGPFQERVFGDYPDLDYELARTSGTLPDNIKVVEFYFPPGKFLHNPKAQQNYISSNYTHVVRDMMDRNINVLAQLVAEKDIDNRLHFSLSCNADVTTDMAKAMEDLDYPCIKVAQVNDNLPFMYGEAQVDAGFFDLVLDDPAKYFTLFGPPKMSVSEADFMIGLYSSTLVKDDGEIQIGIGSLGDATVYNLILRHENNQVYKYVTEDLKVEHRFRNVIQKIGGLEPFKKGLFGATEMVVDGFMHLYNAGIIRKKVYDDYPIQRMINANVLQEQFDDTVLEIFLAYQMIGHQLSLEDFYYLQYWGILRDGIYYEDGMIFMENGQSVPADLADPGNYELIRKYCLGKHLKNGQLMHGGFFLGPQNFYTWLRELPDAEKKLINMKSVQKINQLYGHENLDRLHRKNARFINSCMMHTLSGAAVSDGLEDGRVISGVGGQYNFVAMAQELPDGHSIINLRSTRIEKDRLVSNMVMHYGHITIPRHLRDIVVTEYGIAFIRGKTDEEVIMELLNITDSRFQQALLEEAKANGKIRSDYTIPLMHQQNFPEFYQNILKKYKTQGYYSPFPFGTDLNEDEIKIGKALKGLKKDLGKKSQFVKKLLKALVLSPEKQDRPLLERMSLARPKNVKEWIYQKLLLSKFREYNY